MGAGQLGSELDCLVEGERGHWSGEKREGGRKSR